MRCLHKTRHTPCGTWGYRKQRRIGYEKDLRNACRRPFLSFGGERLRNNFGYAERRCSAKRQDRIDRNLCGA